MAEEASSSGWRVDKRIPIWGIAIGVGQGIIWGGIMYFTLYSSQMNLDKRISLLEQTSITSEKFGRLDERLGNMQDGVRDVKTEMGKLTDELRKLELSGKR